ncbi:hypothetical protein BO1005MUT1_200078 [Hyphomicrobiales bacterium]|nr:hypothetical protein BO1005MUT1_200078 [Hyphomicrobiales bacterium]
MGSAVHDGFRLASPRGRIWTFFGRGMSGWCRWRLVMCRRGASLWWAHPDEPNLASRYRALARKPSALSQPRTIYPRITGPLNSGFP